MFFKKWLTTIMYYLLLITLLNTNIHLLSLIIQYIFLMFLRGFHYDFNPTSFLLKLFPSCSDVLIVVFVTHVDLCVIKEEQFVDLSKKRHLKKCVPVFLLLYSKFSIYSSQPRTQGLNNCSFNLHSNQYFTVVVEE